MFKKLFGVTLLSFSLLLISLSVSAQTVSSVPGKDLKLDNTTQNSILEPTDCFSPGLYQFQSVQVSVGPEKDAYSVGENINFVGNIINQNEYPVVDGTVFVRISKDNKNYIKEGYNVVDEVVATSSFSIDASSSLPIKFSWLVPKNLGAGDYRADYFFSVGNKFNLGGLPFTNEIVVGSAEFKIIGTQNTEFMLDRVGTKVNGIKYNHIGGWPFVGKDSEIKITQPIKNLTSKEIMVTVNYDLYFWDSLNPKDKLDSKTETVIVPANSSKDLIYTIPESEQSVYYLRIKATVGDASSIVNIRTTSDIERARINYPAITTFPLLKGESTNLFSCFHTVYGIASSSKLILTLTDKDGSNVAKGEYNGSFGEDMSAALMKFTSNKDYYFLNLKAELFDDNGKIVDSYQTKYDCATLNSDKCQRSTNASTIIFCIISILILLLGLYFARFIKKSVIKRTTIVILFLLLVFSIFIYAYCVVFKITIVQASAADIAARTRTNSVTMDYKVKLYDKKNVSTQALASGDLNFETSLVISTTTLLIGDNVDVSNDLSCTFNGTGSNFDTPYCGDYFKDTNTRGADIGLSHVDITWSNPPTPTITLTSSNPSILSCSGTTCTALGVGTAKIYVDTSNITSSIDVGFYSKTKDTTSCYGDTFKDSPCPSKVWDIGVNNKIKDGTKYEYDNSPYELDYTPPRNSFSVRIYSNPIPTNGSCGSSNGTTTSSIPNANLCTVTSITPSVTGTGNPWLWSCTGSNGGTNASCSANKTAAVNGSCGSSATTTSSAPTANLCTIGTPTSVTGGTAGPWLWSCTGSNGGTNASCTASKTASGGSSAVNGSCGSSNGTTTSSIPNANLCTVTSITPSVTGTGNPWLWSCTGSNGGTNASCSANKTAETPTPTPGTISGLNVTDYGGSCGGSVIVSWDAYTPTSIYNVTSINYDDLNDTSFHTTSKLSTIFYLHPNTHYDFKVSASDQITPSDISFTTSDVCSPTYTCTAYQNGTSSPTVLLNSPMSWKVTDLPSGATFGLTKMNGTVLDSNYLISGGIFTTVGTESFTGQIFGTTTSGTAFSGTCNTTATVIVGGGDYQQI